MHHLFSIFRFTLVVAAMLAGLGNLSAQTYPDRPIHLLVPYPPGGPNDTIARFIANKLAETRNWPIVVENRPGGSGNLAVIATARSAPDGYTLVLPAMAYAVNPSLFSNAGYSLDQFAPVSIPTEGPLILVVHPSLGVKSVQELIALAKKQPGKINYGSGGNGTSLHLAAELFKRATNVDMQHIPYKGTNELMTDLLTGRVPVGFISPLIAKQHVANHELLALAITSKTRLPSWPDTPTVAEAGVPGYTMEAWYAIVAPKDTPKDIINTLSGAIAEAVKSPDVAEKFRSLGTVPVGGSPTESASYIETEAKRWHDIIVAAGIHLE
jgi:tripartite-type tricarboxylate transporter receptor subunit TctC